MRYFPHMPSSREPNLAAFVDGLHRQARYTFTRDHAATAVTASPETLTKALQRFQAAGRIHRIRKGFYTIVPLERNGSVTWW